TRQQQEHVEFTLEQLRASLAGIDGTEIATLVIAYEPVWAIGTGEVAGPEDAQEMAAELRTELSNTYGRDTGQQARLLYGGSVKLVYVLTIMNQPDNDCVHVGGASIDDSEFASIVRFEHHLLTD